AGIQQHRRSRLYSIVMAALAILAVSLVQVARADISVACGDSAGLSAAINSANSAGGPVITLAAGCTYPLTAAANSGANGANGLPVITSSITINGNGSTIARASADAFRILEVAAGGNLTLNNLRVSNGKADGTGNAGNGGGIFINAGGLITFNAMTANTGAVDANSAANDGGGLYIVPGGAIVVALVSSKSSVAMQNSAGHDGGGIYVAQNASMALQTIALNSSVAMANHAGHDGGGLFIAQGGSLSFQFATLDGSVATNNSATND